MADVFSPAERSRVMAAVRSRGNRSTELALAVAFRATGVTGWRRHFRILGSPDFVFPKLRFAVFVDGCFWHGCPRCGSIPATNREYWQRKILRNTQRDSLQRRALRRKGWKVARVWEHQLRGQGALRVAARISRALATRVLTASTSSLTSRSSRAA